MIFTYEYWYGLFFTIYARKFITYNFFGAKCVYCNENKLSEDDKVWVGVEVNQTFQAKFYTSNKMTT